MKQFKIYFFSIIFNFTFLYANSQALIIDHNSAFLEPIPAWAIQKASDSLHIAYGHTSHGSQITYGMKALANQSEELKGYKGDFYCWKEYHEVYGDNPCLDIDDSFRPGDLGHNGDTTWASRTRDYLLNENRAKDINVVMWSWCGGCSDNTDEGIQTYLDAMNQLEKDFPNIKFIYMTGHLDHWSDETLKHNNQLIRNYCIANNKILYDFADIESYDPDGNYFEFSNDNCDYYDQDGNYLGNWAEEWQNSHVLGHDWYQCSAAHSKPLNGNRKAYAAWWLWARLIGWKPDTDSIEISLQPHDTAICDSGTTRFSIDFNNADSIRWQYKVPGFSPFIDVFDNDIFTGATEKTLMISVPDTGYNGYMFRCQLYLNDTFVISDIALLQVDKFIKANPVYDSYVCTDTTTLYGNDPYPGQSEWIVDEGNAILESSDNIIAKIRNLQFGSVFIYKITNGTCVDSDTILILKVDPIEIINQPDNITATTGDSIELEINTKGNSDAIQWYKNLFPLTDNDRIKGSNTQTLRILNVSPSDFGDYYCEIYGFCNTILSDTIHIDVINSIDKIDNNNIKIFPNPFTKSLNIYSENMLLGGKIVDYNGKTIKKIKRGTNIIDTSNLIPGIYIIQIKTPKGISFIKIVKLQ